MCDEDLGGLHLPFLFRIFRYKANHMTVSEDLKNKAIKLGLCDEWTDNWGYPDLDGLCEKFIEGQDFCIKHGYPSNEYIKNNFGKVAEKHGIFVDTDVNLDNPNVAVLLGSSKGEITLSGYISRDIYVRNDSNVDIRVTDHAVAFIRVFNNARIRVISSPNSRVFIYKYIDNFTGEIETEGRVLIREKKFSDL